MQNLFASWSYVLSGLLTTFQIAGVTLVFATLISAVFGVLATVRNPIVRGVIHVYVELFRAIPLIVNVFFMYFTLPTFGVDLPPFASVALGLTLWGSANGIEIVRGGIQSVPAHQWSSAWALGMRPWEIYWFIVGPQSLRAIVPSYTGLITLLIQATSLGALVGVTEFLKSTQIVIERSTMMTGQSPAFQVYLVVLLVYFFICSAFTWLSRYLERRLNAGQKRPVTSSEPTVP